MKIVVTETQPGFFAAVVEGTYKTGTGRTRNEAIGTLVCVFPGDFGIEYCADVDVETLSSRTGRTDRVIH
jgi:hypothetical protein